MRIYLTGFMGAGKTFLGQQLAQKLNFGFVDMDEMVMQYAQLSIADIFHHHGEDFFRRTEHLVLRNTAILHNTVIATGGGTPCFFDHMKWMNAAGTTIFINPSTKLLCERLSSEQDVRPLIKNIPTKDLHPWIEAKLSERLPFYKLAQYQTLAQEVDELIEIINNTP